uniref:Uncharacterized protein n=1 Tax=Amphimedon queenslandica TaxID=400682 RepID=A0A1X7UCI8_AMPQE
MIKVMAQKVLQDIIEDFQTSSFLTVMADETTDAINNEQVTLIICWVTKALEVHKEFGKIDSNKLTAVKDVLLRTNLSIHKFRRQCYDGASS